MLSGTEAAGSAPPGHGAGTNGAADLAAAVPSGSTPDLARVLGVTGRVPRSLLLVEDEPSLQRIIGGILVDAGHAVEVVDSAERALDVIARRRIDAVITDKNLPGGDGLGLLAEIRAAERGGRLAGPVGVVLTTGYPSRDSALQALGHDVDAYLVKPFVSLARAAERIQAVLDADLPARRAGPPRARRIAHALGGLPEDVAGLSAAVVAGDDNTRVERALRACGAKLVPAISADRADIVVAGRLDDLRDIGRRRAGIGLVLLDGGASFRDVVQLIDLGGGVVVDPAVIPGDA
jgi:CheY-like chemotaxis protein